MAKYTMRMVLEWARVFKDNADMGDPEGPRAAKATYDKGGQYVVNAYFTDQADIDKLLEDGVDPNPMNGERFKEGNPEFGIGKFMVLKRPVPDIIKTYQNKSGEVTVNYGGPVEVLDFREYYSKSPEDRDVSDVRKWDLDTDGLIGNGSVAMVQFETYSKGAGVRLSKVGVVEHVAYEGREVSEEEELFEVI